MRVDTIRYIQRYALGPGLELEDELGGAGEVGPGVDDANIADVGVVDHAVVWLWEGHGDAGEGEDGETHD